MTFIPRNTNNNFTFTSRRDVTSARVFDMLDAQDGKKDGRINADIWNTFAQRVGGKTITSNINRNEAMKSINTYIQKGQKGTIFNYFNDKKNQPYESPTTTFPPAQTEISTQPFSEETITLNSKRNAHSTHLLDVAESHIGIIEISESEYNDLKKNAPEKLKNTQYSMIGNHGEITDQWCAHTVSTLSERAGVDIGGHKKAVSEFIDWAEKQNDFKEIKTNWMNKNNAQRERELREVQIADQLQNMKEGDFIVWKASYTADTGEGKSKNKQSSHIGIIESVDPITGTVTVIEGNANLFKKDKNGKLLVVNSTAEGKNGDQEQGDFQEVNRRDGLIRKVYTIQELAAMGYRGYIDNQSRVNPRTIAYNNK